MDSNFVQLGKQVLATQLSKSVIRYLETNYNVAYLGEPFFIWVISDVTVTHLQRDEALKHYWNRVEKTLEKKTLEKSSSSEEESKVVDKNKLHIVKYKKSYLVLGDTKPHKEELNQLGLRFGTNFEIDGVRTSAWLLPPKLLSKVEEFVDNANESSSESTSEEEQKSPKFTERSNVDINSLFERIKGQTLTKVAKMALRDENVKALFEENHFAFEHLKEEHNLTEINSFQDFMKLDEELSKAQSKEKLYMKATVPDLVVGDRVTLNNRNYVVTVATNNTATIKHVTFLGKILNDSDAQDLTLTRNNSTGKYRVWMWSTKDWSREDYVSNTNSLKTCAYAGIFLYDDGPKIDSLDSPFLKYRTLPDRSRTNATPRAGMLVTVANPTEMRYFWICYLIIEADANSMTLRYIKELNSSLDIENNAYNKDKDISPVTAQRISGNSWMTDKLGKTVIEIGNWYSAFNVPY